MREKQCEVGCFRYTTSNHDKGSLVFIYVWVVVYQPRVSKRDAWLSKGLSPSSLARVQVEVPVKLIRAAQTNLHAVHAAIPVERHEPEEKRSGGGRLFIPSRTQGAGCR